MLSIIDNEWKMSTTFTVGRRLSGTRLFGILQVRCLPDKQGPTVLHIHMVAGARVRHTINCD